MTTPEPYLNVPMRFAEPEQMLDAAIKAVEHAEAMVRHLTAVRTLAELHTRNGHVTTSGGRLAVDTLRKAALAHRALGNDLQAIADSMEPVRHG